MNVTKPIFSSVLPLLDKMNGAMRNPSVQAVSFYSVMEKLSFYFKGNDAFRTWMETQRRCMQGKADRMEWWGALESFTLQLLASKRMHVYVHGVDPNDIPWNDGGVSTVSSCPIPHSTLSDHDVSVVLYKGEKPVLKHADLFISIDEVWEAEAFYAQRLQRMDYFQYDRHYLQAKLHSLPARPNIHTIFAGSSYAMCGLREQDFPIPTRSIAVDAQDITHTIQSVETALAFNPAIHTVVMAFAPYLFGVDLCSSSSVYNKRRVRDVNEPLFTSPPPRVEEPRDGVPYLIRHLFLDKWMKETLSKLTTSFEDGPYFRYPRDKGEMHKRSENVNDVLASNFVAGHNKFCTYHESVQANTKQFHSFVERLHQRAVRLILFSPPMSPYYRPHLSSDTFSTFTEQMATIRAQCPFTLLDLTNDERFILDDFYDFDHLNDQGAQKLSSIISPYLQ